MKLIIQQRPIAIDSILQRLNNPQNNNGDVVFDIMDEARNVLGLIKKFHHMGAQDYCAYDNKGNMIIKVHRDSMHVPPTCDAATTNGTLGTVTRNMTFGTLEYEADFGGYTIAGDGFGRAYRLEQYGTTVMQIHMDTSNLVKCYTLDLLGEIDEMTALALLMSIDCLNDSRRR